MQFDKNKQLELFVQEQRTQNLKPASKDNIINVINNSVDENNSSSRSNSNLQDKQGGGSGILGVRNIKIKDASNGTQVNVIRTQFRACTQKLPNFNAPTRLTPGQDSPPQKDDAITQSSQKCQDKQQITSSIKKYAYLHSQRKLKSCSLDKLSAA